MSRIKRCTKCGVTKLLDGFRRNSTATDGRQTQCKSCLRILYYSKSPFERGANEFRKEKKYRKNQQANANREQCKIEMQRRLLNLNLIDITTITER